jgi:hypothetical protein
MRMQTACLSRSPTTKARAGQFFCIEARRASVGCLVLMLSGLASTENLQGQYLSRGQAVGILAGIAVAGAGVGIGVTYLILHNRGITTGCVTETGGRRVLTTGSKAYSLIETEPALALGKRYKLKGQTSGPSSVRTFTVNKMLKDLGGCP